MRAFSVVIMYLTELTHHITMAIIRLQVYTSVNEGISDRVMHLTYV